MKAISLAASQRTLTKTTGSKKIRGAGRIPGILYGNGDPENIELESIQFEKAIKWHKGMVEWFQKITGWDDYTLLWFAFLEGVILTLLVGYIL